MAELNDVRLFTQMDNRIGSPAVARRLLEFKRVANPQDGSELYLTGQTKAEAERLQAFAAKHGVQLWRVPRLRRRPKVSPNVNDRLIARFVDDLRLREGAELSARALVDGGAIVLAEALNAGGGRSLRLAASGGTWTIRTKCPGEEASASLVFDWHDDDRHAERDDIQSGVLRLYASTVASLTKAWGEPESVEPDEMTQWAFPRTTLQLRLHLSDMFGGLDVHMAPRSGAAPVRRAASRALRRPKG